jgi:putative endonuclease
MCLGAGQKKISGGRTARQGLGRTGERLAAEYLQARGCSVVERNFRCSYGEVDLIVEDGEDLAFVEVKTRRGSAFGLPEEAVTRRKQLRIMQVAAFYLDLHACSERSWRIDVIAIQLSSSGKFEAIRYYPHAVRA